MANTLTSLCAWMQVVSVQQCSNDTVDVSCFECSIRFLLAGQCLPGLYTFNYTVTNSQGYTSQPLYLQVSVYEMVGPLSAVIEHAMPVPGSACFSLYILLLSCVTEPVPMPCALKHCSVQLVCAACITFLLHMLQRAACGL